MLKTQVQVSKDTGEIDALYIWEEDSDFPWQAGFTKQSEGGWAAGVEHKDEEGYESFNDAVLGETVHYFPTLLAALQAYLKSPHAVPSSKYLDADAPYGIVLG